MKEVSQDIMAAAIRSLMVPEHEMATSVARALLAEREATEARTIERCAELADGMADEFDVRALEARAEEDISLYREAERTANQIAAAIRSQGKE